MYSGYAQQPENLATKAITNLTKSSKRLFILLIIVLIATLSLTLIMSSLHDQLLEIAEYQKNFEGSQEDLTNDPGYQELLENFVYKYLGLVLLGLLIGLTFLIVSILSLITLFGISKNLNNLVKHNSDFRITAGRASLFINIGLVIFILAMFYNQLNFVMWVMIAVAAYFLLKMFEQLREMKAFDGTDNWFLIIGLSLSALVHFISLFVPGINLTFGASDAIFINLGLTLIPQAILIFGLYKFHTDIRSVNDYNIPELSLQNQYSTDPYASSPYYPKDDHDSQSIKSQEPIQPLGSDFCSNCSSKLDENSSFCSHCGQKAK